MTTTIEERIAQMAGLLIIDGEVIAINTGDNGAGDLFAAAHRAGSDWKLADSEKALDQLYKLAGGENEYTGMAWHQGKHPLQKWIAEQEDFGE